MSQELKEKVQTLEETMQNFIRHTERAFSRLSISMTDLKNNMDDFKEEMQEFKTEMAASRDASAKEMQEFKNTMEKKWGELANRLGTLAEDVVAPNVVPLAHKYFNCSGQPLFFMVRCKKTHSKDRGLNREFDAFAVFEDTVILSETKSTPRVEYVEQFVQAVEQFFEFFPEYAGKKLIPIFASLYMDESITRYATRKNIYVMALQGDTMDILNFNEII